MYNLPLKFGVLLLAEPVLPLNNNGDWVRAKIPLADTGFRTFELGGVTAAENGKIRHFVMDFMQSFKKQNSVITKFSVINKQ